jgi:hypothetical protein
MSTQLQAAKEMLFGDEGLRASNFKMYPGSSTEVTPEEVAAGLNEAFALLKAGKFKVVAEIGE